MYNKIDCITGFRSIKNKSDIKYIDNQKRSDYILFNSFIISISGLLVLLCFIY